MYTIEFDRAWIDKLTTIDVALQVYHKDKFLDVKRRIIPEFEFDEEAQTKVWEDYHNLLYKAASKTFGKGDIERLDYYRQLGNIEILPNEIQLFYPTKVFFPTTITRDNLGKIVKVSHSFLDHEITRRWFEHIYDVLVGRVDLRVCAAKGCLNLVLRKRRKDTRFCSNACRNRVWRKNKKSRDDFS